MNVSGTTCVVTGAGRGIGRRIAVDLARAGGRVYACDVSPEAVEELARHAADRGLALVAAECDVSDEASVAGFFAGIVAAAGGVDVLVNNAGITRDGLLIKIKGERVTRLSLDDFRQVLEVNLTGVFLCVREAAPIMARTGGGVVVNISSVSRAGNFGQTNYSASKAGVDAMTVTWSKELSRYGIRVAGVAPGYTNTEMVAAIKPEILERITRQVPLKRLGTMEEISRAVQFIVGNDFVNGRILEIDGGLRI